MIPRNDTSLQSGWKKALRDSFTDPADLCHFLALPPETLAHHFTARKLFPMRVPRPFAARMKKGDPQDPLLRQVLPLADEFHTVPGFVSDPLAEQQGPVPGLLHKYRSRVLLILKGGCAINCRYCFRRHFPYADNSLNRSRLGACLDYIASDTTINEVILSGGDPLMADNHELRPLLEQLNSIGHVRRLRLHTRLPVTLPERIDTGFCRLFEGLSLQPVTVLHINHANEIDAAVIAMCQRLRKAGHWLLNQSVLLKGVNDNAEALVALSEALFDAGVQPYYLHLLDKVAGASHFLVDDARAIALMHQISARLPGFLLPRLSREIPGKAGKTLIDLGPGPDNIPCNN